MAVSLLCCIHYEKKERKKKKLFNLLEMILRKMSFLSRRCRERMIVARF